MPQSQSHVFDADLLEILVCPENLGKLRLADAGELAAINEKARTGAVKQWDGQPAKPAEGLLIREDGKVAYRIEDGLAGMIVEEALVLDATVGKPAPELHRKRN